MCIIAAGVGTAVAGAAAGSLVSSALAPSGNSSSGGAQAAANAADPFSSQRGQYQAMLSQLINNPSSITSQPGYQFGLQQSNNAVEGSAAANGMVNSGNVLQALSTNSQQYASQQLNNQELLLAQLAGANVGSPGTAGQILQGQNTANQQSAGALGSQVGGAITNGFNNAFSNSGTYSGDPFATDTSGYGAGANTYGFSSGVSDPSYGVGYGFDV
jgi:hypothetical protein